MANKFIGQRKWVQQALKKFSELDEGLPETAFDKDPEWPDWVFELLLKLMDFSHPGTKFKNNKNWKAKDLGRFLGRQYAGEFLIQGKVPVTQQVIREAEKYVKWSKDRLKQKRPDFKEQEYYRHVEARNKIWRPRFQKFIQETLSSACERPYIETRDFFEAFGKAMVMRPEEFESERTMGVGDKICWTMVLIWKDIERLQSVAQLHQVFEQALKPKGIVIKYKRIEKLCHRIGLKFKDRGRPAMCAWQCRCRCQRDTPWQFGDSARAGARLGSWPR